jgi:hypothetical protein
VKTLREALIASYEKRDGHSLKHTHPEHADAALSALCQWLADEGLVVVPREATVGMFRALTLSQMNNDDLKFKLGCWALGSFASDYAAMIAASPDVLGKP